MSPLDGVTVIEFGDGVAVGYCGALFAAAGAEVVKVERPKGGDSARRLPPFKPGVAAPEASGMHAFLAAGKQGVAIDLETAEGGALGRDLAAGADVVLEGMGPGRMEALGLGFDALKAARPGLVMTSLSWFGADGPRRDWAASDAIVQALSGFLYPIGEKAGPPIVPGGYQAQITAGMTAFIPTMAALVGGLTGAAGDDGRLIDQSILEAELTYTESGGVRAGYGDFGVPRRGLNKFQPTYPQTVLPAAEGWIGVTVLTPLQWRNCCEMIGADHLIDDPLYATSKARMENADALEEILIPHFLKKPAIYWFHEGQKRRVPLAIIPTMAELATLDHYVERGVIQDYSHPDIGGFTAAAIPWKLGTTPLKQGGRAPRLGEHTADVLAGRLDIAADEIDRLAAAGVIRLGGDR